MMEKWTHCVLGLTNSWHMAVVMLTKPSLLLVQILTINEITSQWNANFPRNDPGRSSGHGRAATIPPQPPPSVRPGPAQLPAVTCLVILWPDLSLDTIKTWRISLRWAAGLGDIMVQVMVLLGLWMLYSVWFLVFFWHIKDTCENCWLWEWQQLSKIVLTLHVYRRK